MAGPREPIFLARETYRRRRLIDAVRVLPVVGLGLFLAPLVGAEGARTTALGGFYIFAVWFGLIVATAALVRLLAGAPGGVGSDPLDFDRTAADPDPALSAGEGGAIPARPADGS